MNPDLERLTEAEVLAHWKRAAGDDSPTPWTAPEDLGAFFQRFRPEGHGLQAAVGGLALGDPLMARLARVYQATASGYVPGDAYFLVRAPASAADEDLRALGEKHLRVMSAVASDAGNAELAGELTSVRVSVRRTGVSQPGRQPSQLDTALYETVGDWILGLDPEPGHATLLREAAYLIACDYMLQHYVLWPLYQRVSSVQDPFKSYFALWTSGAQLVLEDPLTAIVVPAGRPP